MPLSRILLSALAFCAAVLLATWDTGTSVHAQAAASKARARRQQSHHGRRAAEPGPERDAQLGSASRGPEVGLVGRHRHRSDGRPRLGLRALRRGRLRRGRPGHVRHQPGRSDLQVRPADRRGAGELRQGHHGDAARHPRRQAGQRVDCRLRGQRGRHEGAPGSQVQPEGREAPEPRHRGQARQRRRPVQSAERRRGRARRQHLRRPTGTTARA